MLGDSDLDRVRQHRVRQVLLTKNVSRSLLALRGDTGANGPVFASRKKGGDPDEHSVHVMVKRIGLCSLHGEVLSQFQAAFPAV